MRSFILAAITLAVTVTADAIPGLPSCTSQCISSDFGGCGQINAACICNNKPLIDGLACCVSTACSKADQDTTLSFANKLCAANGVTDLPQTATCASSSATGASTASSAASSASGSSSATSTSGSAVATGTAASSGSASGSATTSHSSSATAASASTSASASATKTGSANKVEAAAFGVGAVVLGALAAL